MRYIFNYYQSDPLDSFSPYLPFHNDVSLLGSDLTDLFAKRWKSSYRSDWKVKLKGIPLTKSSYTYDSCYLLIKLLSYSSYQSCGQHRQTRWTVTRGNIFNIVTNDCPIVFCKCHNESSSQ